jgi:hypothetical protein
MLKRLLFVVVLLSPNAVTYAGQTDQSPEPATVEGTIESLSGSPVRLLYPSYQLIQGSSNPKKFQITGHQVRVENTSGRTIRRLRMKFVYAQDVGCCSSSGAEVVDWLAAGESRVLKSSHFRMSWVAATNDMTMTVMPTGAEFGDGSHWAAPRSARYPLFAEALSLPESHLIIRQCSWVGESYKALLDPGQTKIAAYRLGVVKDTPDGFDLRLGNWIHLTDTDSRIITDESASLSPDQVFPRENYTFVMRNGRTITHLGGVAIFVAELEFIDGKTWRQNTSRDALLWCN